MFPWFHTMLRDPCSTAVAGSASRRCAPPPTVGAEPGRRVVVPDDAPVPGSNRPLSLPNPPICPRRPRQPRSPVAQGSDPTVVPAPTRRRPGPEYRRDAPPPPTAVPGCPPRCGVCAPSPSWRRRSLWAPFFSGLHRLAVDDGRTGAALPTLGLSQRGMQCVMRPFPDAITTPGAEIMGHDAPGRQVMRQHPPGTTGAQHIADGVDYLPPRVRDRPTAPFGRWQQRFQQLPFSIAEVAGISSSVHTPNATPNPSSLARFTMSQSDPF